MGIKEFSRWLLMALPIMLAACASGPQMESQTRIFPPSPLMPLEVVITQPLVPFSYQASHEALEDWNESPSQRRRLMSCVWLGGLQNMTEMMIPGTNFTALPSARNPLSAMGSPVESIVDSLGQVTFQLSGHSAIDLARRRGWTHLVVPYDLHYQADEKKKTLSLETTAAIIDVLEQKIVWQGTIDSKQIAEKKLGSDGKQLPALTPYEATTYRFILDLARILDRRLAPRPDTRHQLAAPCQDPPPLLQ